MNKGERVKMDRAAKLARMGDRLISFIAMISCSLHDAVRRLFSPGQLALVAGRLWFRSDEIQTGSWPVLVNGWTGGDEQRRDRMDYDRWYTYRPADCCRARMTWNMWIRILWETSLFRVSIFLSCLNSLDFSDPYSLLYGHHMENGGMFGDLTKFLKKDYFDDHKTGTLYSLDSQWDIEVFAVLKTGCCRPGRIFHSAGSFDSWRTISWNGSKKTASSTAISA